MGIALGASLAIETVTCGPAWIGERPTSVDQELACQTCDCLYAYFSGIDAPVKSIMDTSQSFFLDRPYFEEYPEVKQRYAFVGLWALRVNDWAEGYHTTPCALWVEQETARLQLTRGILAPLLEKGCLMAPLLFY